MIPVTNIIEFKCENCEKEQSHCDSLELKFIDGKKVLSDKIDCNECGHTNHVYKDLEPTESNKNLNRLEVALLDKSDDLLDSYLEIENTVDIRNDIIDIIEKSTCSTETGILKRKIQYILDEI